MHHHAHHHDHGPRRYGGVTIDTHAHWYPAEFLELLRKEGTAHGGGVERTGTDYKVTAGKLANAFSEDFVSVELPHAGGWTMDRLSDCLAG